MYRRELPLIEAMDLAFHLPPGAETWRSTGGAMSWTDEMHLAASRLDVLRVLAWQQTEDGHKGRNAPEPVSRPTLAVEEDAPADFTAQAEARAQVFRERQAARAAAAAAEGEG